MQIYYLAYMVYNELPAVKVNCERWSTGGWSVMAHSQLTAASNLGF